jgi:hypothetical protein
MTTEIEPNNTSQQQLTSAHLELTPEAKARLAEISERTGMTQSAVLCRLLEWFVKQQDVVQSDAMGHYHNLDRGQIMEKIIRQFMNGAACIGVMGMNLIAGVLDLIGPVAMVV